MTKKQASSLDPENFAVFWDDDKVSQALTPPKRPAKKAVKATPKKRTGGNKS